MSALDHAAVHVRAPAEKRPLEAPPRLRRLPAVSRAAMAFALLWLPLTLVALATEWRVSWGAPAEPGTLLADYVRYGSAISGPLPPQLILVTLALVARRSGRLGLLATGAIGLMGALIAFNGAASAFTQSDHAPQAAASIAGLGMSAAGVAMALIALRRLVSHATATAPDPRNNP